MTSAERARMALFELQGYEQYSQSMVDQDESRLTEAIDAAVAEALAARWVLVGERLPEYGVNVLLTLSDGTCSPGWRALSCDDEEGWTNGNGEDFDVLAWQPLPAPWVAP